MSEKDGIFDAKMELKLTSCSTLSPFSEAVELTNLRGATSIAVHVYAGKKDDPKACVDVAKDCGRNPRLIVLRPMSVRFKERKEETVNGKVETTWKPGPWLDMSSSGITPDKLAKLLTFKAPGSVKGNNAPGSEEGIGPGLGRPQFYFDGLLNLLLEEAETPKPGTPKPGTPKPEKAHEAGSYETPAKPAEADEKQAKLSFDLAEWKLAADGTVTSDANKVTKELNAVTVQFIAAYS